MREYIKLVESLDRYPSPEIVEYYTNEGCGVFAYALWLFHERHGTIRILSNPMGEKWNDNEEITHVVYCTPDHILIDVRGTQMPDEIAMHFHLKVKDFSEPYDPEYFWTTFVGMSDECPLYGDNNQVQEALDVIRQYPDIY